MSVSLHLNTEQQKVFKRVMRAAKIKGLVYHNGKPELDKSNFETVVDAIQAAWFKELKEDEDSKDAEVLRTIGSRLDGLWVFFEAMPEEPRNLGELTSLDDFLEEEGILEEVKKAAGEPYSYKGVVPTEKGDKIHGE